MIARLAILAPGLLGASVAQAARARGTAAHIAIHARRPEVRLALERQPWCDSVHATPAAAAAGADLIVVCTPVERIAATVAELAPALAPDAVITDVGSVKGEVCRLAAAAAGAPGRFVGAHPMAGSERSGWEAGDPALFTGRPCFVTPWPDDPPAPVERVVRFWSDLGAHVTTASPDEHDEIVAHLSHLPHLVAATLAAFLATRPARWRGCAGPGLRDSTRIAAGDPELWRGILESNRDEVLRALRELQDELARAHAALANRDGTELRRLLAAGKSFRDSLSGN